MASGSSNFLNQVRQHWDPETLPNYKISAAAAIRIKNDLTSLYRDPVSGISVVPDSNNLSIIHALITGPMDTPYQGGFFNFLIGCTPNYPIHPPKVKLKTTGFGTVRFNPNFYKNGKVCLSILGTWSGPEWTPVQNLSSLLISIRSIFNEKPYFNEPGYVKEVYPGDSSKYNLIIQHETIRCAVCDVLEKKMELIPDFQSIVESSYSDYFDYYIEVCEKNINLDGKSMTDPFGEKRGKFAFCSLKKRLLIIRKNLDEKYSTVTMTTNSSSPESVLSHESDDVNENETQTERSLSTTFPHNIDKQQQLHWISENKI